MNGTAAAFLAIPEALVLGLVAAGAGRRLLAARVPDSTRLERSVLGFPLYMGLLSLVMTAALFSKLPPVALRITLLAFLGISAGWARGEIRDLLDELREFARKSPVLAALIGASALLGLLGCMAPETGYDTGVYHFTMARLRAEQGGMIVRMDIPHGYRPAYMESLNAAGFLLNGETLASTVNLLFYFAGLAMARLWGIRIAGARGGLFAALAWMTSITYVLRMDGGDVEVGQAVYAGTALMALLRHRDGAASQWRVVAGVALGLLLGIKYSSVYVVLPLAVAWGVVRLVDRAPLRGLLMDGVVLAGLGLLIASPFYLRNRLETGVLFFPYQATIAQSGGVDEAAVRIGFVGALRVIALDGFVVVGVAALFLKSASRDRWTGILALVTAVLMVRQVGLRPSDFSNAIRYASAVWLPLLVLGGAGVAVLWERGGAARWAAVGVLCAAVALGQGVLAARTLPKLPAALGIRDRDAYLADRVGTYAAVRAAETGLPPGKKILLVEERAYYCRAPFLVATDLQSVVNFDALQSADDVRRLLREESIGAIVVDRSASAKTWRFRNLERRLGPAWPPPNVRHVSTTGDSSLYRVD